MLDYRCIRLCKNRCLINLLFYMLALINILKYQVQISVCTSWKRVIVWKHWSEIYFLHNYDQSSLLVTQNLPLALHVLQFTHTWITTLTSIHINKFMCICNYHLINIAYCKRKEIFFQSRASIQDLVDLALFHVPFMQSVGSAKWKTENLYF